MQIKYAVYPGQVTSRNDGDRHVISAGKLMELYGVCPSECIVMQSKEKEPCPHGRTAGLTPLFPRYDGHYHLPREV